LNVLLVYGSRNPEGQTARAGAALALGLSEMGAWSEAVFLPLIEVERCRQCDDNGWGTCRSEGVCVIEDDFAGVVERIRRSDAVAVLTPVYYGDLSESLRAFLDRLRRVCTHDDGKVGIAGKPCIGIAVAGGGGGGSPTCLVSLERVLGTCGFDVLDLVPVRRQNADLKASVLKTTGAWLARTGDKR